MSQHPHLSNIQFEGNETADTYESKAIQLVKGTIVYLANQIVKSVDAFDQFTKSLLSYSETFTIDYIRDIIFFVSCSSFPEVAIFMLDHGLYTQHTLKTIYKGSLRYPLEEAIQNNNISLINCFGKLDCFEELLIVKKSTSLPPLFSIIVKNATMLKCVLESEYCTEETLKTRYNNCNTFEFVCNHCSFLAMKTLLESEKCTINVIMESHIGKSSTNVMTLTCFELLLKSNKLPNDFFVGKQNFGSINNSTLFIDSSYCNVEMVEDFINNWCYKESRNEHYLKMLKIIFARKKYSHLTEKYNLDGSVKSNCAQKNEMNTMKEYFNEVKDTIDALQCEIQMLNLTIKKMELEREMDNLKQTN